MREIKFRAWDKDLEKMFRHEDLLKLTSDLNINLTGSLMLPLANKRIELMQYTNLKDKNGKEIYEGDIVEYKTIYEWAKEPIRREEVVFEGGMFGTVGTILDLSKSKVLGNIYENPELLEMRL